ncbi:DUF305 domain-containing protein [Saccharopolyspora griseoalba]|uniref:DUF305 domain-containing protein n=1 Tax=Saccharopolyspora griseoalba TaxID=1431848 RepID=A0ABW2LBM7_9PSEU
MSSAVVAAALLGAASTLLLVGEGDDQRPNAVDVGFAQDMTAHHQQGVAMATLARERSRAPGIRQLAFDIEHVQTEQMGRMRAWLGLWSQPISPVGEHMGWMAGPGHEHGRATGHRADVPAMPGMATTRELEHLRSLSRHEFDAYFLQLMIRHHQGGAPMMRAAAERAAVGEVRNLSARMLDSQTAEVELMKNMLAQRGSAPLPSPN